MLHFMLAQLSFYVVLLVQPLLKIMPADNITKENTNHITG